MIGAFDVFRGENYWRVRGPRILGWHLGADTPLVRRSFDRRFRTGLAKPRARSLVTAGEIAALLGQAGAPPSALCPLIMCPISCRMMWSWCAVVVCCW
jgi:hypothetical protein